MEGQHTESSKERYSNISGRDRFTHLSNIILKKGALTRVRYNGKTMLMYDVLQVAGHFTPLFKFTTTEGDDL